MTPERLGEGLLEREGDGDGDAVGEADAVRDNDAVGEADAVHEGVGGVWHNAGPQVWPGAQTKVSV